ncbi:hemicentin-1 isoform X2 [Cylas formicarius]|nr:hemicentin-1 isoform X2 [Cylas formicarius]
MPRIFDAEGREVKLNASAGPFLEGHELFLSCEVNGGRPRPMLTWWYNDSILDSVVDSSRDSHTSVNQLLITAVPRHLKGARLECRTSSSENAGDIVREVPITVFLKPNKVKIVTPNDLLSISKSQTVRCETSGSYPPAKLIWVLDGKPIRNAVVTVEETTSFTGSILTLNVHAEDDGKVLVCRADNPRFPGGSAQDSRRIHVAYPPKVAVSMDSSNMSPVREGSDVILRCETRARPTAHSYYWYHNSHLLPYNESAGTLPSNDVLTLKNIKQTFAGQYACSARNSEGETYSSPFDLTVQFAPRCKKGFEEIRIGIIPHETIVAQCLVDSVPPVNRFSWTYNTSKGVLPVQGAKIQSKGNASVLHFDLREGDVESLACWATNDMGKQEKPCIFHIVPAEPPEPPRSCIIRNMTGGGFLEVSCIAGKDGGLHQSFVLEVTDLSVSAPSGIITTLSDQGENASPAFRVLGERPLFRLPNLKANKQYQMIVYAENARGRSVPPVVLPSVPISKQGSDSLQEDDNETDLNDKNIPNSPLPESKSPTSLSLTLIIAGLSVTAVLLIVVIIAVSTVIACRKNAPKSTTIRKRRRPSSKPPSELELSEAGFGEGFHRRSALYRASMYGECEERISRLIEGPDLILAPVSFSQQSSDY